MKKIFALLLFVSVQFAFAQKSNKDDVPVTYKNPSYKGEVFLSLNMEWFKKDPADNVIAFTSTDKNVEIMIMATADMSYKKIVDNLKKKTNKVWEILPAKKIVKVKEEPEAYKEQGMIALAYAVPITAGDDRIVSMMVLLHKNDVAQWEAYFDHVAGTLGVIPMKEK